MQRYIAQQLVAEGVDGMLSRRKALHRLGLMGAGTVAATLAATPATRARAETDSKGRGNLMVNVREHGAVGDGVTDDTPAIHSARDTADEGGTVLFPPGTYLVRGLAASVDKQVWELRGGATVRMMTGASEILEITGSGVTIDGGEFDGSNGTAHDWSQQGIVITADDVAINRATVRNSPKLGIYVSNCNNVTVTGCSIINSWDAAIFANNTMPAPSKMRGVHISDNLIDNADGGPRAAGIGLRGETVAQRISNISICRNTVRLPYNQPNQTGGIGAFYCEDWMIDGNSITGGWASITSPTATRATVSNNICRGFWGIGIEIPDVVTDCIVANNTINPDGYNATDGIIAGSEGQINRLSITRNSIVGFTGRCSAIAINGSSVNNVTVTDNAMSAQVSSGQQFTGVSCSGNISTSLFTNNSIDANSTIGSYGMQFTGAVRGVLITGNVFANIAQRVITFVAAGEALDHIAVTSNTMTNCADPPIYLDTSEKDPHIFVTDATVLRAPGSSPASNSGQG